MNTNCSELLNQNKFIRTFENVCSLKRKQRLFSQKNSVINENLINFRKNFFGKFSSKFPISKLEISVVFFKEIVVLKIR